MCCYKMRQYSCSHFTWFMDSRCERKGVTCPFIISGRDDMYELPCAHCRQPPLVSENGVVIVRQMPFWAPPIELIIRFYGPRYPPRY